MGVRVYIGEWQNRETIMRKIKSVPNRAEQVYAIIRDSICDARLKPGTHLVQEELASSLGVSRQPIQQAMLLLKADGLVIESGARGLYVAPMDPEKIGHHYQLRIVLDRLAAKLVAERIAENVDNVRAHLEKMGQKLIAEGRNVHHQHAAAEAVALDMKFHSLIYECSGNPFIAPAAELHWNFLRRVMISVLLHAGRGEIVWQEHAHILDLLLAGDVHNAEVAVESHIVGAQQALNHALSNVVI